jgi:hypothetical protein
LPLLLLLLVHEAQAQVVDQPRAPGAQIEG